RKAAEAAVLLSPKDNFFAPPPQSFDFCEFVCSLVSLVNVFLNRAIQISNSLQNCRFRLTPLHAGQGIMQPFPDVRPSVQDLNVFQYLVGGHASQIVECEPSLFAALPALLDNHVQLPSLRLGIGFGLEDTRHCSIGLILRCCSVVGLSDTEKVLLCRIGSARSVDPVRLGMASKPRTTSEG